MRSPRRRGDDTFDHHVRMRFSELLSEVTSRSRDEDGFVGSAEHLAVMQTYVTGRAPELRLEWSGDRTFYEPASNLIALEQPPAGLGADQAAELIALSLDHELAHARFTDQAVYADFIRRAPQLVHDFQFVSWIIELFNFLEDARLVTQVSSNESDAAADLGRLNAMAAQEWIDDYQQRNGESPWSSDPPQRKDQAGVALIEQILVGQLPEVHPDVDRLRDDVQGHVDAARSGSTADVAEAAVEIYNAVVGSLR